MGCASSRHNFALEFEGLENYHTIGTSFQGAIDDEPKLRPIDAIDHLYRRKVENNKLIFDEELTLVADPQVIAFAMKMLDEGTLALRQHIYELREQKIGKNSAVIGQKYLKLTALTALESTLRTIDHRNKQKHKDLTEVMIEVYKDKKNQIFDKADPVKLRKIDGHYQGIQNFPKLMLYLILRDEYLYDYITYCTLSAEIYPKAMEGTSEVGIGALAGAIASVVSKGQDLRSEHEYSLEQDQHFYCVGRQNEENFKILIQMASEYHAYDQSLKDNFQPHDVKKTIMVFPGLTRAFRHKKDALHYLDHTYTRGQPEHFQGLIKICFRIEVNFRGHNRAMDVKKFFKQHHQDSDEPCIPPCDGLFQRLVVQVQQYQAESHSNHDCDALWINKQIQNGVKLLDLPEFRTMTHEFTLSKLQNPNDPNLAPPQFKEDIKEDNTAAQWKELIDMNKLEFVTQ